MKSRNLIFVIVLVMIVGLLVWSGIKDRADEENAHVHETEPGMMGSHTTGTEQPVVSNISLAIKHVSGDSIPSMTITPGSINAVTGTIYSIKATDFYTHWNFDGRPVNLSFEEKNPAVKIEVFQGDSLLYYQWAFKNMPFFGMGGFSSEHPGGKAKDLAFTLLAYEGLSFTH